MPDYIFNTTAISNFAAANRLDLLAKRYNGHAFTTIEVYNELRRGFYAGYTYLEVAWQQLETTNPDGWIRILNPVSVVEHHLQNELDTILDSGEASCLTLAISRKLVFITDDLAARRLAKSKTVSLTGTLGILIVLVRHGTISLDEANTILSNMIKRNYRSPVERLDELI